VCVCVCACVRVCVSVCMGVFECVSMCVCVCVCVCCMRERGFTLYLINQYKIFSIRSCPFLSSSKWQWSQETG